MRIEELKQSKIYKSDNNVSLLIVSFDITAPSFLKKTGSAYLHELERICFVSPGEDLCLLQYGYTIHRYTD